jgi:phosphotransferase system enzyme I (PtsI)
MSEIILKGIPICRGIAIGKPFFFENTEDPSIHNDTSEISLEKEVLQYRQAINQCHEDIKVLAEKLVESGAFEAAAIMEAQLQILQDPLFTTEVEQEIVRSKKQAASALQEVVEAFKKKFNAINDPFFRERFKDIQDISKRVIGYLRSSKRVLLSKLPPDTIIFSKDLSASETAEAHIGCAGAFVTESGGAASHTAIVAKARGTPYVSNIAFSAVDPNTHHVVIVDGRSGEIILNPKVETLAKYQLLHTEMQMQYTQLSSFHSLATETHDGYLMKLSGNIESASELDLLHSYGGHGVGLYRSEYIVLRTGRFPSEEEQFAIYLDLIKKMKGAPIVIRTFDIGGDKQLPNQPQEVNPFLGCRAIRFLLKEPDIFKTQLRAILKAAHEGDVSIMFPLISTLNELQEAKRTLKEVQNELKEKGKHRTDVKIGCMIEVPSAVMIADLLARECDFLSIGTNDLVQYALAVDRGNHALSSLYSPAHPSVIRMIKSIIQEANFQGVPVTVCGEMASDPQFVPLLLGLGVNELSVSVRFIPVIKQTIRNTSILEASRLADKILEMSSATEIISCLK